MIPVDYAERAKRWFRRTWSEPAPRLPADRQRMVGAVEQLLRARARRRTASRLGAGVGTLMLAVAASIVLLPRLGPWIRNDSVVNSSRPRDTRSRDATRSPAGATAATDSRALKVQSAYDVRESTSVESKATATRSAEATAGTTAGARQGVTLEAGVELVAPLDGEIRIGTAEGTSLTIEPHSHLVVANNDSTTQRFSLKSGAVRVRVAKLHPGERFLIDTADAEIEVHGTAFRVALAIPDRLCGGGTVTRVSVTEGIVSVRAHGALARLVPGDDWPADCRAVRGPPTSRRPASASVAPRAHFAAAGAFPEHAQSARMGREGVGSDRPVPGAVGPLASGANGSSAPIAAPAALAPASVLASAPGHSRLGAQNDLFAAAVGAKGRGHTEEAIRLFAELARQYPDGPLAESALVQRMKLLRLTDPRAAKEAAAEYLAQFPGGFARGDARALAGSRTAP